MNTDRFIYIVSSLPLLQLGEKNSFSFEDFLDSCSTWLTEEEMDLLKKLDFLTDPMEAHLPQGIQSYLQWERILRNRLAFLRCSQASIDSAPFLKEEIGASGSLERIAHELFNHPNPLERERLLDRERWNQIENCTVLNSFSLDSIAAFKLKFLLCQKWEQRNLPDGKKNLDELCHLVTEKIPQEI